jgi:hypothetical protein
MTLSPSYHHRRIRRILKLPAANALSPRVQLLARAVWEVSTIRSAHARCLAELPSCVTAEMEGNLEVFHGSSVQEHLLVCHRCADIYTDLLEIAILDAQGRLPPPSSSPPDLSFLETPNG